MSRFDFKLPDIGEGVMEGEIVKWLVQPGDVVGEDEPVAEVMTDKATVTITSPKAGKIVELGGGEGEIIAVHSTLVVLDLGGGAATPAPPQPSATQPSAKQPSEKQAPARPGTKPTRSNGADDGPAATAVGDIREELPGMAAPRPRPKAPAEGYFNPKPLATPASRKLARDLGVDLRAVPPSGPHDRVSKDDIRRFADGGAPAVDSTAAEGTAPVPAAPQATVAPIVVKAPSADQAALEVRTPLKGVRKRIFDAMARSKHTAAHFTFVEECDVTALKALRERLRPMAADQGVKLTYLPFFVKASVAALKKHPSLNGAFDESTQEIVERRYYNIGIASATEAGLMVPVIKNADRRSILDVAREIQRLGEATKSGKIAPDDLSGSTFTITSLGQQGGLFATPILNTPEVAILGIHQMKQKPVVRAGKIVIGDVMLLSLSFDHRLIDGHVGAAFAYDLIALLETPDRLLLEMG